MTTTSAHPRSAVAAVALGFGAIVFDGYDLIVYGSVMPALLDYEPWGLGPARAGAIGSYALLGMFIGAIRTAIDRFRADPIGHPDLPNWIRVRAAVEDVGDRLVDIARSDGGILGP
jgi:hypothetical protein